MRVAIAVYDSQWVAKLTTQWVSAGLMVALVSIGMAAVCAWYLRRKTQNAVFGLWSGGWSCYGVSVVALLILEYLEEVSWPLLQMACLAGGGLGALFILAAALRTAKRSCPNWLLGVAGMTLVALSGAAAFFWPHWFWLRLAENLLLASAGGYAGWVFWRQQNESTRILAWGWMGWAVTVCCMPLCELWAPTKAVGHMAMAVPTLAVAMGLAVMREADVLEKKYRDLLEASSLAIFVVDLWTLEVMDANRVAQLLVRHGPGELQKMPFKKLCPELQPHGETLLDHRTAFHAVFKPYHQLRFLRKDGAEVWCEGDAHQILWRNRPAMQVNVRETDRGKTVGQLVHRSEKLTSLGQLVSGVAHELNNPLAVVLGNAQMLVKQEQINDKTRAITEKILHESERAAKIVRDLLSFAHPGQAQLAPVDINQIVNTTMRNHTADFQSHNMTHEIRLGTDMPPTLADAAQLEQVLTHLVRNAIQAMADQPTPRKLVVTTETSGLTIRITVRDTGPGIPPEIMGRIFDPFFTTKGPGRGTGLGLSICNTIMDEHHGKIWAQNNPDHGATFYVELPIVACDTPVATPPPEKTMTEIVSTPLIRKRILLVDDEPGIRDVLAEVLTCDGYEVDVADGGEAGWERINARSYDVVVSDLNMPGLDGAALYQRVLSLKPKQAQRFVFLTGDTVGDKWRTFLEGKKNRWLTKPFNIREIEDLIAEMTRTDKEGSTTP